MIGVVQPIVPPARPVKPRSRWRQHNVSRNERPDSYSSRGDKDICLVTPWYFWSTWRDLESVAAGFPLAFHRSSNFVNMTSLACSAKHFCFRCAFCTLKVIVRVCFTTFSWVELVELQGQKQFHQRVMSPIFGMWASVKYPR